MNLQELKRKYSGQEVPEWELVANGLKQGEAPKRGRAPKVEAPVEEGTEE